MIEVVNYKSTIEHEKLISKLVSYLEDCNYIDIKANHIQFYSQPEAIGASIPDITAIKNGTMNIFEVETSETINDMQTEHRWQEFSKYASQILSTFWIIVPKGFKLQAERKAIQSKIKSLIIEI